MREQSNPWITAALDHIDAQVASGIVTTADGGARKAQMLKAAAGAHTNDACPACGYCPHCGRRDAAPVPYVPVIPWNPYPQPYISPRPYWHQPWGTFNITASDTTTRTTTYGATV